MPVDLLVLGAALLTGLLGGVHCAAMCGGIATGFSVHSRGWLAALQPNLGRVAGYVIAGGLVGGLGGGLLGIARLPALGPAMRALAGLVLVVAGLRMLDRRGRLPRFSGGPGAPGSGQEAPSWRAAKARYRLSVRSPYQLTGW